MYSYDDSFYNMFLESQAFSAFNRGTFLGMVYIHKWLVSSYFFKTHLNQFCYSTSSGHVQTVSTSSGHVHKASVGAVHLLSRATAVEARTPILHSYNKGHVIKKARNAGIFFK